MKYLAVISALCFLLCAGVCVSKCEYYKKYEEVSACLKEVKELREDIAALKGNIVSKSVPPTRRK